MRFAHVAPLFLFGVASCSSGADEQVPTTTAAPLEGPSEWNRDVAAPDDNVAAAQREQCGYHAGDLPQATQGKSHPMGESIPINHTVIVMMENRSFDHYFQKLPEYGQPDADVAPPGYVNPAPDGSNVAPFHIEVPCYVDTNHEWNGTHEQINGGKMDGFVKTNQSYHELPAKGTVSGSRALAYHDATDLPFYYWMANEFAIADRYFPSIAGPTFPNRMYFFAATSMGAIDTTLVVPKATIFDYLEMRKVAWKVYTDGTPSLALFPERLFKYRSKHVGTIADYIEDAKAGTLPSVAFVDPVLASGGYLANDEHPPAIGAIGQVFVAKIVQALTQSPNWPTSALFLTWDEHGGLYDHVPPPAACPPDDIPPNVGPNDAPGNFDLLGPRVPFMVVSPFAKKHFVAHRTYDHTSVLRFLEARYVMPAMTHRDANAEVFWEMFDFDSPPHREAPSFKMPVVDASTLTECKKIWE